MLRCLYGIALARGEAIRSLLLMEITSILKEVGNNILSFDYKSRKEKSMKEYAFVFDKSGKQLSPTDKNNAWRLIRTKKARCIKYNPFTIVLNTVIDEKDVDQSIFHLGIDDGSANVGFSILQYCMKDGDFTKVKTIQKAKMIQRQDVKHLMTVRREYRNARRHEKRCRECRFQNRAASRQTGRIAPTIKQKRQAVLRVANYYKKLVNLTHFDLEDVSIDIRALTEGEKLEGKEYQKSNRQDDNIRRAVYLRDKGTCQMCGKTQGKMEAHHIHPRRLGGPNSIHNEILLCHECHASITNHEEDYEGELYKKIDGKLVKTDMAQHVMIGKKYLREELSKLGTLHLTCGGDTANKRHAWNIPKTHANDAICIACEEMPPDRLDVKEYIIKPVRHKKKSDATSMGFELGDYVELTIKSRKLQKTIKVKGYITAFIKGQRGKQKGKLVNVNITANDGTEYKRYSLSKCRLIERQKHLKFL